MEAVGFDLHEGAESICIVVPQRTVIDNDITPIFKCPSILPKGCPEVSSLASSLHKLQSLPSSLSLPTFSLSLPCVFPLYPHENRKCESLSCVWLFATPWTVAQQAPLSMGFSRQEYWSGLPCPEGQIFLTQGSNLGLLHCRQILRHQGSPFLPSPSPRFI